jgi:hypothetical protein
MKGGILRRRWISGAVVVIVFAIGSSAVGQTVAEPVLPSSAIPTVAARLVGAPALADWDTARRVAEAHAWMDAFADWQAWSARWGNRREPGWVKSSRARRTKPAPPAWLPDRCLTLLDEDDPLMPACARLAEWRDDAGTGRIRQVRVVTASQREAAPGTTFWQNIHVDLLWPAMQWQSSIYGILGTHHSTKIKGRWEVFTAPGVLLMNAPTNRGTRVWKVAANYGVGYRLADFSFPGGRPAELHVNLAKTWILSDVSDALLSRTIDVVGFSVTFKKSR